MNEQAPLSTIEVYRVALRRSDLDALSRFERGFWGASLTYLNDINLILNLTAASMNDEPATLPEKVFWRRNREYMLRNIIASELEYDTNVQLFERKYSSPESEHFKLCEKWKPSFEALRSGDAYRKARRIRNKAFAHHNIAEYAKALRDCDDGAVFSVFAAPGRSNTVSDIGIDLPWLIAFGNNATPEEIGELLDWSIEMAKAHELFISDFSRAMIAKCGPSPTGGDKMWRVPSTNTCNIARYRLPLLAKKEP